MSGNEPVDVFMGRHGEYVTVPRQYVTTIYQGTRTGRSSMGAPNIEDYEVVIRIDGVEYHAEGAWYGDARNNIVVDEPPVELQRALQSLYESQQAATKRRFYDEELD